MFKLIAGVLLVTAASVFGANATATIVDGGYTFSQFTAPETTVAVNVRNEIAHTFQFKVAAINTSVTVRVQGSLDGTNWFNLDSNDADYTVTANGTYGLKSTARIKFARFMFVSEVGGVAATIDAKYYGGNQ